MEIDTLRGETFNSSLDWSFVWYVAVAGILVVITAILESIIDNLMNYQPAL